MKTKEPSNKLPERVRKKCERWIDEHIEKGPLRDLSHIYSLYPIVLYVGAGISTALNPESDCGDKPKYGLPTWSELLKEVAGQTTASDWPEDPWKAATRAVRTCGGKKKFKKLLKERIAHPLNYLKNNGQLPGPFLKKAPTLNSVASFCGKITGRVRNPEKTNSNRIHYRSSANPRVHAVLSGNYDCFLESAASNVYRKSPLKPVTALGSMAGSSTRIPVFHFHGYVPHLFHQKKEAEPLIDDLVITREDYEKHWNVKDVFGTTMAPQIHYLRYYTVLFIGFSFKDDYVCNLLEQIHKRHLSKSNRTHFALVKSDDFSSDRKKYLESIGITLIECHDYCEIPAKLGEIYKVGLVCDQIIKENTSELKTQLPEFHTAEFIPTGNYYEYSIDKLWDLVMALRNESVPLGMIQGEEKRLTA